ncbi:MAG: SDR family NAD(P)-dependent oxidoreductase, partial [Pseudomonadota bacterium]|nr:SDR family NAD(P)-dependent oxidoreductase [Pseudomonadota bacterium]
MPIASLPLDLLVFGGGYLGRAAALEAMRRGGRATATSRDPERRRALAAEGIVAIDPTDTTALKTALEAATAILITAAPDAQGCPGLRALGPLAGDAWPDWIGYVSSTSVYGDRAGGWVFEDGPLNAAN